MRYWVRRRLYRIILIIILIYILTIVFKNGSNIKDFIFTTVNRFTGKLSLFISNILYKLKDLLPAR